MPIGMADEGDPPPSVTSGTVLQETSLPIDHQDATDPGASTSNQPIGTSPHTTQGLQPSTAVRVSESQSSTTNADDGAASATPSIANATPGSNSTALLASADHAAVQRELSNIRPTRTVTSSDLSIILLLRGRGVGHSAIARILANEVDDEPAGLQYILNFSHASAEVEERLQSQIARYLPSAAPPPVDPPPASTPLATRSASPTGPPGARSSEPSAAVLAALGHADATQQEARQQEAELHEAHDTAARRATRALRELEESRGETDRALQHLEQSRAAARAEAAARTETAAADIARMRADAAAAIAHETAAATERIAAQATAAVAHAAQAAQLAAAAASASPTPPMDATDLGASASTTSPTSNAHIPHHAPLPAAQAVQLAAAAASAGPTLPLDATDLGASASTNSSTSNQSTALPRARLPGMAPQHAGRSAAAAAATATATAATTAAARPFTAPSGTAAGVTMHAQPSLHAGTPVAPMRPLGSSTGNVQETPADDSQDDSLPDLAGQATAMEQYIQQMPAHLHGALHQMWELALHYRQDPFLAVFRVCESHAQHPELVTGMFNWDAAVADCARMLAGAPTLSLTVAWAMALQEPRRRAVQPTRSTHSHVPPSPLHDPLVLHQHAAAMLAPPAIPGTPRAPLALSATLGASASDQSSRPRAGTSGQRAQPAPADGTFDDGHGESGNASTTGHSRPREPSSSPGEHGAFTHGSPRGTLPPSPPSGTPSPPVAHDRVLAPRRRGRGGVADFEDVHAYALANNIPFTNEQPIWFVQKGRFGFVCAASRTWDETVLLFVRTVESRPSAEHRKRLLKYERVKDLVNCPQNDDGASWGSNYGILLDDLAKDFLFQLSVVQSDTDAQHEVLSLLVSACRHVTALAMYHPSFARLESNRSGHKGIAQVLDTCHDVYLPMTESAPRVAFYSMRIESLSPHKFLIDLKTRAPVDMSDKEIMQQWASCIRSEVMALGETHAESRRYMALSYLNNAFVFHLPETLAEFAKVLSKDTVGMASVPTLPAAAPFHGRERSGRAHAAEDGRSIEDIVAKTLSISGSGYNTFDSGVYEVECYAAIGQPERAITRYDILRIVESGLVGAFRGLKGVTLQVWNILPVCGAAVANGEYGINCPICIACEGDISDWREMSYGDFIKDFGRITRDNLPRTHKIILTHSLHCCPQIKRHCGPWTPCGKSNEWLMHGISHEQYLREIKESKQSQGV